MSKRKEKLSIAAKMEKDAESSGELSDKSIARLATLAFKQLDLEKELRGADESRAKIAVELDQVRFDMLPTMMRETGVESFTLDNGAGVTIRKIIKASIPKDRVEAAFEWLRENKHDGLIKNEVTVRFLRGEDDKAHNLFEEMNRRDLDVDRKKNVNSQTLSAFVKEQLEVGATIPFDLLGVFVIDEAKIKEPRMKKKKEKR